MKIALVCNEYPPAPAGGIGTWTRAFAQALAAAGDQVWVIGEYPDIQKPQTENTAGVQIVRLPASRISSYRLRGLLGRWNVQRALGRLHRQHQFDVIEIPDYRGYGAFYRLSAPLVVRLHHLPKLWADPDYAAARSVSRYEVSTLKKADAVIAVSQWCYDIARREFSHLKRMQTIYYTISDAFWDPMANSIHRENNLVVFAGTLTAHKGVWELAKAWPDVKRRFPAARLVLIGKNTGTTRQQLEQQLANMDVSVIDHVSQDELANWYRRATVACFPSKNETFGLVAAEAMVCGAPVIYTTAGPGPEVGGNGSRALLVDPNDSQAVADAICTVLSEPMAFREQVERAKTWVCETMSPEATLAQSKQLYGTLQARF